MFVFVFFLMQRGIKMKVRYSVFESFEDNAARE